MILRSQPYIDALYTKLKQTVSDLARKPKLVIVQVGSNAASRVYVNQKLKRAAEVGIEAEHQHYDVSITEQMLIDEILKLNIDDAITGYIIQLPLPDHINIDNVITHIDPKKDADGFHPQNVGQVTIGSGGIKPCTPHGVIWLLESAGVVLDGLHAVVVGRSNLVGKPLGLLLLEKNATVTMCHSRTVDLQSHLKKADLVIAAAGVAQMIDDSMLRDGVIVIDVGIHKKEDGSLCGDVDFERVVQKASLITPVPGGVGPVTVAMLLQNIVEMARER